MGPGLTLTLAFSVILLLAIHMAFQIYGIILCFKKKWYMGLAALAVPGFALVVGAVKAIFGKDLLK